MTQLPSIQLSGLQVSDLFFNSPTPELARVYKQDISTELERRTALHQDAIEFAELIGNQIAPAALVEDFLARV